MIERLALLLLLLATAVSSFVPASLGHGRIAQSFNVRPDGHPPPLERCTQRYAKGECDDGPEILTQQHHAASSDQPAHRASASCRLRNKQGPPQVCTA
jgi:hypothetical protein